MSDVEFQPRGYRTLTPYFAVDNVDAAVQQAVDAGAELGMPPADMFWCDRFAKVRHPFGHKWSLATQIEDVDDDLAVDHHGRDV